MMLNRQANELERLRLACKVDSEEVVPKAQEVTAVASATQLLLYVILNFEIYHYKLYSRYNGSYYCTTTVVVVQPLPQQ